MKYDKFYFRKWRADNKEHYKKYCQEYYKKNKARRSEIQMKWYRKNRAKQLIKMWEYRHKIR